MAILELLDVDTQVLDQVQELRRPAGRQRGGAARPASVHLAPCWIDGSWACSTKARRGGSFVDDKSCGGGGAGQIDPEELPSPFSKELGFHATSEPAADSANRARNRCIVKKIDPLADRVIVGRIGMKGANRHGID